MAKKLIIPAVLNRKLSKDDKMDLKGIIRERNEILKIVREKQDAFAKVFRKDSEDKRLKKLGREVMKYIKMVWAKDAYFFKYLSKLEKTYKKSAKKSPKKSRKSRKSSKKSRKSSKKSRKSSKSRNRSRK